MLLWAVDGSAGEPDRIRSFQLDGPETGPALDLELGALAQPDGDGGAAGYGEGPAERPGTPRVDWSRGLRDDWQLNTVILNRRQAGQPGRVDDDLRLETFGFELRRPF